MGHDQSGAAGNQLRQKTDGGSFCRHIQPALLLHMTVEDVRVSLIDLQQADEKYDDELIPSVIAELQSIKTVGRTGDDHRPAGDEPHAVILGERVLFVDIG